LQSALAFVPSDLIVRRVEADIHRVAIMAEPRSVTADCSQRHLPSHRVHSRYPRRLADLPWQGRAVIITVMARRFRCGGANCPRKVFVERLPTIAAPHARRTARLAEIQRHVGLALGGAAGARLAHRLGLPVSGPTLLRLVRLSASSSRNLPLHVIGIDDWAWRRGHRYGSIVCDLERRRIVDLLPDRTATTVQDWLAEHPDIEVIARDRGGAYGAAAASTCPGALQVADRWHLMENASAALLDAVRRSMRRIRAALGAATVAPSALTSVERRQHAGFLRRTAAEAAIRRMVEAATPIKEVVRRTGHSQKLVRAVARGARTEMFSARMSTLEAFRHDWTPSGSTDVATARNFGAGSGRWGSPGRCASSPSGQRAAG
jgi:transposase